MADRLDDLVAWQLADELRKRVYMLFSEGPAARDARLKSQAEDAASSVCRNLAEGFHRFNPGEFARYARYSASSVAELGAVLADGVARGHWTPEQVETAEALVKRTGAAVGRLQRYLRSKRARENAERILRRADISEAPNRQAVADSNGEPEQWRSADEEPNPTRENPNPTRENPNPTRENPNPTRENPNQEPIEPLEPIEPIEL